MAWLRYRLPMRCLAIALLVSVALGACFSGGASSPALDAAPRPDATSPCTGSLVELCSDCPATEQEARDLVALDCTGGGGFPVLTAGQCGDFRYVQASGGFGGEAYYYDDQDQLVGAFFNTDTPFYCEGTSFSIAIGAVPDCERIQDVDLCPAPSGSR